MIGLASDHNGVALKTKVKEVLQGSGHSCIDLGPFVTDASVDYVDYALQLGAIVARGDVTRGILICGTGIGMSIAANRIPGVRAALVHDQMTATKSREHNDANVLCLGSWTNGDEVNVGIVETWMEQKFGEERHIRRVQKLAPREEHKLVFTNGVFDMLHAGHVACLKFARSLGGKLVVGINSDRSVRELKGSERPVNNEHHRKAVLQSIKFVDEVCIFDDATPTALIRALMPHVIVKGGEYTADEVRARDAIPVEVEVKVFPMLDGLSTTSIIESIRKAR